MADAAGLLRVTVEGLRPGGGGRGAWLCPRPECFEAAVGRRAFERALRADLPGGWHDEVRRSFETATGNVRG